MGGWRRGARRAARIGVLWLGFAFGARGLAAPAGACSLGGSGAGGLHAQAGGAGALGASLLGLGGRTASGTGGQLLAWSAGGAGASPPACLPGEPASVAAGGPATLAGNPVDLLTGAKLDRAVDLHWPAAPTSLEDAAELLFSRVYASDGTGSEALGPGWRHGFETRLYARAASGGGRRTLEILQADGRTIAFARAARLSGGTLRHAAIERDDGLLDRPAEAPDDAAWIWRWRSGRTLTFDAEGRLRRMNSPDGAALRIELDARGRPSLIVDAAGRALRLSYFEPSAQAPSEVAAADGAPPAAGPFPNRLAGVTGPAGRRVAYAYDGRGRLASVRFDDEREVRYAYAQAGTARLAGIRLPDGRESAYRYDAAGRVTYSRGVEDRDDQALSFAYASAGPLGREGGSTKVSVGGVLRARYDWTTAPAGAARRLAASSGEGCARCPPTGLRYGYRRDGRLARVEDGASHWTLRYDRHGRLIAADGRGDGADPRSVAIEWVDDDVRDRPARVSRPGIAPGGAHALRFEYRADGRLAAVEESGFAPDLQPAGADEGVRVSGHRAIRRVLPLASPEPAARRGPRWPPGARIEPRAPGVVDVLDAQGVAARYWLDDFGRIAAIGSRDGGLTSRRFDTLDRLAEVRHADGSRSDYAYDAAGRLVSLVTEAVGARRSRPGAREEVRLAYEGDRLVAIDHPAQSESFVHDLAGRLRERLVDLDAGVHGRLRFRTEYRYDPSDGALVARSLPDGRWLRWHRDASGQVVELALASGADQAGRPLATALERDGAGVSRFVLGNGVAVEVRRDSRGRIDTLEHRRPPRARGLPDPLRHRLAFDARGRLREWVRHAGQAPATSSGLAPDAGGGPSSEARRVPAMTAATAAPESRRFLFDDDGQLLQAIAQQGSVARVWRYAYDEGGDRVLEQQPDVPGARAAGLAALVRDAAGRVVDDGRRRYVWGPSGELLEVRGTAGVVARYAYNHRGERVSKSVAGRVTRYLYDEARRLSAELDDTGRVLRQYVYLDDRPLAVLEGPRVWFVHANHLGAPEAVTDARASVVWRAAYAPFGRRLAEAASSASGLPAASGAQTVAVRRAPSDPPAFDLPLRLPGQYEDAETGLHYNDHRYYDPDAGRYLSPDPLGLAGGPNPYAYAANDPLTRVDPSGLLLFAFDGTDNSDPPPRRDDWSNVYKLARSYADGRVWYMAGVGRDDAASGIRAGDSDAVLAGTARARVDHLLRELSLAAARGPLAGRWIDVDVIGFSRGAAMARDFSNRVADRIRAGDYARQGACVRLRFLGLWDTVAQFGLNGTANLGWRLAVPAEVGYAAHAVALNEHRTVFPAESIVGSPLAGVRIERGFVGAHSDVGGSYAEGDLSDAALAWMHAQAQSAGVRLGALPSEFTRVTSPLLHDSDLDRIGDREFRYRNGTGWVFANPWQRQARIDGLQWRDTARFIRRAPSPLADAYGEPTIVGAVEMRSYAAWLAAHYGVALDPWP